MKQMKTYDAVSEAAAASQVKDEIAIDEFVSRLKGPDGFEWILVESVSTEVNNHRQKVNKAKQKELEDSILRHGLKEPIGVVRRSNPDRNVLRWGFRRLLAFKNLKLDKIPAMVSYEDITDEQIKHEQMIENLQREDLSPIDEALMIKELMIKGTKMEIIAARLGKGPTWARERLDLLRIDKKHWPLIASGRVPLKHAILIARVGDKGEQGSLIDGVTGYLDGEDYVEPLSDLRQHITGALCKLGSAYWPKDKPYAGKIACIGCPDNTNSEPTLFEALEISLTSSKGNCTNRDCFEHKLKAWDKDPEKKRREKEREKQKAEQAKKAMKAAEENPEAGKQTGETAAAREARVKALKKKFPWTAEQKLALALYDYGEKVVAAIEQKLLASPPANALDVLIVIARERSADLWFDERDKGYPTLDQALKGTRINGKTLRDGIWKNLDLQFDDFDKPGVDNSGQLRQVPIRDSMQEELAILAKIAKAWKIDVPRPEAKDFKDDPAQDDSKSGPRQKAAGTQRGESEGRNERLLAGKV